MTDASAALADESNFKAGLSVLVRQPDNSGEDCMFYRCTFLFWHPDCKQSPRRLSSAAPNNYLVTGARSGPIGSTRKIDSDISPTPLINFI